MTRRSKVLTGDARNSRDQGERVRESLKASESHLSSSILHRCFSLLTDLTETARVADTYMKFPRAERVALRLSGLARKKT